MGVLCVASLRSQESPEQAPAQEESRLPATAEPLAPAFSLLSSVRGRVLNEQDGAPLLKVEVRVAGTEIKSLTGLDGRYRLGGITADTCDLVFTCDGFRLVTVTGIRPATETDPVDVTMVPEGASDDVIRLEALTVSASTLANTPTTLNIERKRANVPIDAFSSVDFSKFPISNAADALRLMPGVSIMNGPSGKFAVVRGLAERYNPVMLDGIVLPSPDPERQTPQLDLFPSKLLDALVIYKASKPDLPAFSSGGAIDLRTRPFPDGRSGQVQFGLRADDGVFHEAKFASYATKGQKDMVASGKSDRASSPAFVEEANGTRSFFMEADTPLGPRVRDLPIGARLSVNFEDRLPFGDSGREFAYGVTMAYDSGYSTRARADQEVVPGGIGANFLNFTAAPPETNDYVESTEEVGVGIVAVLGLKLGPEHSLTLSAFMAQNGEDTVREGFNQGESGGFNYHQLHYKQRNLTNVRLGGEHGIGSGVGGRLKWRVARVTTSQEEPDFRFVPYERNSSGFGGAFGMVAGGPERRVTRYWRDVEENSWVGGADYEFGLGSKQSLPLTFRVGVLADTTERAFTEEAFRWGGTSFTFDDFISELPQEMNRRAAGGEGLLPDNSDVNAERTVVAPFAGVSTRLAGREGSPRGLSFTTGVQWERYRLSTDGLSQFGSYSTRAFYNANPGLGVRDLRTEPGGPFGFFSRYFNDQAEDSWLPSAGLVWTPLDNLVFRLNAGKTTARPSFRELGPYYTLDQVTLSSVHGNIALRPSAVKNLDLRVEYFFPRSLDLVALSFFAKRIDGAIERVGLDGEFSPRLTDSWVNNENEARVEGVEFEFRKGLGFLGRALRGLAVGGNGAWIDATVTRLAAEQKSSVFRSERRLYDQPEWIANGYVSFAHEGAGFSATASLTAISDVLRAANQVFVDEFARGHTQFNLTVAQKIGRTWTLRLAASNLNDAVRSVVPDPEYVTAAEADGFAYARWREGRSYSLTLQKNF